MKASDSCKIQVTDEFAGIPAYKLAAGKCGDVAQVVRACGSYPQCPGFKSLHRHHFLTENTLQDKILKGLFLGKYTFSHPIVNPDIPS